ncbi:GDP-Man:Man(1)GlcNAc(2)-PP-dolichol alpha-1,3-mannosyltransferase [Kluyveromyces lactis]|uniref:Alpha-1,3/1,6-mannosyltransferase ALG2 n=1 Tax=Kluyveromyces lactis (strain ATCC 8585 / CBS 2359 / DSM 70799 / NBRC 1267 / NRRL Y-1140 / WM37) TaxID=284590 RepID=ALG2_KLULA|nr:uncharacterized protein KLLA0_B02420g [Kluyveromyces lactis]Q6CWQ0.1 RecName: Full=Alpha-1,3/1,6-mannosyltransferase ALG2; AltName: Full=Asparagine-linked glycosylation protein 2; AltName: Full=GDP-Man:Man(1)GlcNAc(2)-PP-Dol alpha-1,3-mannosyltransferase; AltName: Full=GDP-Man:Man(1)GlcNAc(2)-PP-dolichol mannosyltransferase; AltName: Full=GDP-Man:Man(2)GlcNAc(2)-PP-Dol alpha-1,6-mannosyltransferase [Kluyveromyces lactis NRRL Y-1140]CAH02032.1 KLLA0B02420p [Kluyveromyces lactis]|eukprot:XP_451639.1 uncharacterized protein KLLA0_B02420g [Kluyveromyces lactis]
MSEAPVHQRKVAFIHPDLGIGGAERLVVDAAAGLQNAGYDVTIYTSHCDKSHCFEEVKNGTLKVEVRGDALPTHIFGKFSILCANLRQLYLTWNLISTGKIEEYDVYIVDQLSSCVPLLHLNAPDSKVLFYCHFPDQLLARRDGLLKKLYRIPFDILEQFTMGVADTILVNSNFTKQVFAKTFQSLAVDPKVVYPCVNVEQEEILPLDKDLMKKILKNNEKYYLSINRYERKKNIELAITAFAQSKQRTSHKLFISGGYDLNNSENIDYLKELETLATELKLKHVHLSYPEYSKSPDKCPSSNFADAQILFLTSVSSSLKELLLQSTEMLLYTPSNEHFGIVPLEAMKYGVPVLAVDTGGPLETVVDYNETPSHIDATGWLRPSDADEWSKVLDQSVDIFEKNHSLFEVNGPKRIKYYFSREAMSKNFDNTIDHIIWKSRGTRLWSTLAPGLLMFTVQYATLLITGDASWPYLLLAAISYFVLRSVKATVYWIIVFCYLNYST